MSGTRPGIVYDSSLELSLNIMRLLFNANQHSKNVPYDVFTIPELTENIDLRADYFSWLMDKSVRLDLKKENHFFATNFFFAYFQPMNFYLCNYPFLFDAKAKTLLLETDQTIQMGTAMNNAANMTLYSMMNSNAMNIERVSPFVYLQVSRENLVQDTIKEITRCIGRDLKKPLKVKFNGEEAEDAGSFHSLTIFDSKSLRFSLF